MRRASLLLASIVLLLIVASPAFATEGGGASVRGVDLRGFPSVGLTVASETPLTITAADVRILENGVPVNVTGVQPVDTATAHVDTVLAVDVSNSMAGEPLQTALAAASTFVGGVPVSMPLGILAFAETSTVLSPVTDDRVAVATAVASLSATTSQGTALYDAIAAGVQMFDRSRGQHNLIVVTDGRNTTGTADLDAAVGAANDAGVNVFTIGLAGSTTDDVTLKALASRTGGEFASITPKDLNAVYAGLARQLAEQYVVVYRSKAPAGVTVEVSVELPTGLATARFLAPGAGIAAPGSDREAAGASFLTGTVGILIVVGLTFLAVLNFITIVVREQRRRRRELQLRSRLAPEALAAPAGVAKAPTAGSLWIPRQVSDAAERAASSGLGASLGSKLRQAGWSLSAGEYMAFTVGAVAVAAITGTVLYGPIGGVGGAVLGALVPFSLLSRATSKRLSAFQSQLADILMVVASSLRAGHSFQQALDSASQEIGEPGASEFGLVMSEVRLGRDIDDALEALVERTGSKDLEWAVSAIQIQRKVGGNLAEVLETVARTIRERETLRRQVRVMSAEGRISVVVLTVLPIAVAAYLMTINPDYLRTLTATTTGLIMLVAAGVLMVIGYIWMQKIVRLDDV